MLIVKNSRIVNKNGDIKEARDYISRLPSLPLDIETTGPDPYTDKIVLLAIGDSETQFVFVPIDPDEYPLDFLKDYSDKQLIAVNAQFEYCFLSLRRILFNSIYDPMIADQRIHQRRGLRMGLDSLEYRYMLSMEKRKKDIRGEFTKIKRKSQLRDSHIIYNANDIETLIPIKEKQQVIIDKLGINFLLKGIEFPLVSELGEARNEGFVMDTEKWAASYNKNLDRRERLGEELTVLMEKFASQNTKLEKKFRIQRKQLNMFSTGLSKSEFNFNSPDQVKEFFRLMKVDLPKKWDKDTGEMKKTTGIEYLEQMIVDWPEGDMKEWVKKYIKWKKINKLMSSFGLNYINKNTNLKTGKLHTVFKQAFTATSRLSSGDSDNGLINIQQVPAEEEFRKPFGTDPDYYIMTLDLSGIELVTMASKAEDYHLYELGALNDDLHSPIATKCWRAIYHHRYHKTGDGKYRELSENFIISKTQNKKMRTDFKPVTFGTIYTMQDNKRASTMGISLAEAALVGEVIEGEFPVTFKAAKETEREAIEQGYIIIDERTNARMYFPEVMDYVRFGTKLSDDALHDVSSTAWNGKIQGTQANMVKEAMVVAASYIRNNNLDVKLLAQIHDEGVYKIHRRYKEVPEAIKKIWIDTANLYLKEDFKATAEYKLADHWIK